ncbi:NADH dehydrogenase 1 alpha subcomplex assembly factor 3 [Schizophyllum amplum]|uniref:NADH dehydrogenase 1 alpha subcomplex assembly factor 3 n=1 Tax=Schizophyllum amplum TaxID=97359 RepID=A0A550CRT0_9AGAR|nr:NADH dehydrogenase 1 alpha subcomplex assembly factor 3 [Auriculariopsis ampla]
MSSARILRQLCARAPAPLASGITRRIAALPSITRHRYVQPRAFHTSRIRSEGFTNFLADDVAPAIQVSEISEKEGIKLADGLIIPSSCIFLNSSVFLWDVPPLEPTQLRSTWEGWSEKHFEVFEAVLPRPEIILLGTGITVVQAPTFIRNYLKQLGIQLEVTSTRDACSTYNLLTEEGRRVAAALLPLDPHKQWKKTTA